MNRAVRFCLLLPLLAQLLALPACSLPEVLYQPRPDDPQDGYSGHLAEAGVSTEMDWGPKQEFLLSGYKTLREDHEKLKRRLDDVLAENQNLKAQLHGESDLLGKEKSLRAQSEAEVENLRQKRRELEARVLALGIDKARLEQTALLGKIAALQQALDEATAPPAEAAAPPAGHR